MITPYHLKKPWRSRRYLDWVKSLPSAIDGTPADDPHHVIGHGQGGMGTKASDILCFPFTRAQHNELHHDPKAWEAKYGSQLHYALQTIELAVKEGVLSLN